MMRVNKEDFDFEYIGNRFSEEEIVKSGYIPLSGTELRARIVNRIICGDYLMGYRFITTLYDNGTVEGVNDAGSYDFGVWMIDYQNNTLRTKWQKGWLNTLTRAYDVNGNIEFFDIDTGKWRTTFKRFRRAR